VIDEHASRVPRRLSGAISNESEPWVVTRRWWQAVRRTAFRALTP